MTERIAVGRLAGVFGIKGWLKVRSNTEPASNILNYQPWYLKTPHGLKVVEVDDASARPQGLVVHIKGYDDRDLAAALGKAVIEVEKQQLPELAAEEFYWHQLVGLQVLSYFSAGGEPASEGLLLGEISSLLETGANDVLVVKPSAGSIDDRERLVPYLPGEFVLNIDLEQRVMTVDWDPEF